MKSGVGNMGLKNYDEQKTAIQESNKIIKFLESYATSMNMYIINLGSLWEANADQSYILHAMGSCVDTAADIAYDYSTFSVNSIDWLNKFDALEKVTKAIIPGKKLTVKSLHEPRFLAFSGHIKLKPSDLQDYATKILAYNKEFESAKLKTSRINNKIDKLILERFSGLKQYSLKHIQNRITGLQELNSNLGNTLNNIAQLYYWHEKSMDSTVATIILSGDTSGNLDSDIVRRYSEQQEKVPVTAWPVAKEYKMIDINDPSVFVKQSAKKCTLASNVMMMRRAAILRGDEDWANITEASEQDKLWTSDGMAHDYESNGFNVKTYAYDNSFVNMSAQEKKQHLIQLLKKHPEGVVIYDWHAPKNGGGPHAILLTDYTDGTFYAMDPAGKQERVPVDQTLVSVEGVDQYWVIE